MSNGRVYTLRYGPGAETPEPENAVAITAGDYHYDEVQEAYVTNEPTAHLSGTLLTIEAVRALEAILQNDDAQTAYDIAVSQQWSTGDLPLVEGLNKITVRATSNAGTMYEDFIRLQYVPVVELDTADSDGDGLPNYAEDLLGTDKNNPDTDGDGVPDGLEYELVTDPLVPDGHLDNDGDGLSNADEARLGTDPTEPDSDFDGLSDGEEVHTRHSDPLLQDTDGDGLFDVDEVALGLDPANPASDGATPDGEREFEAELPAGAYDEELLEEGALVPVVLLRANGVPEKQAFIKASTQPSILNSKSIVGQGVKILYLAGALGGTIHFPVPQPRAVNELIVCKLDEDTLELTPLETELDDEGRFMAELDGEGHYYLMDILLFFEQIGFDASPYETAPAMGRMALAEPLSTPEEILAEMERTRSDTGGLPVGQIDEATGTMYYEEGAGEPVQAVIDKNGPQLDTAGNGPAGPDRRDHRTRRGRPAGPAGRRRCGSGIFRRGARRAARRRAARAGPRRKRRPAAGGRAAHERPAPRPEPGRHPGPRRRNRRIGSRRGAARRGRRGGRRPTGDGRRGKRRHGVRADAGEP